MDRRSFCFSALVFVLCLGATACLRLPHRAASSSAARARVERAISQVTPALVRIHVVESECYEGRSHKSEASGSGVIIRADGYVVTNHHVAGDAINLVCTMLDGEEIPAERVGTDPMSDLSVLRLKPKKARQFPCASFGDSAALQVGDRVLAMGSPLALSQSVTEGIVSNTRLTMPSFWGQFELDGENVGSIVLWIGHDAAIYPGNSGGPLVNMRGEVIGINEIDLGLSGAIPSSLAREVTDELIRDGEVPRAFNGMSLQPLFKRDSERVGAIVSDVINDSPAKSAGVKPGDRLVAVNGKDVRIQYEEELPSLNRRLAALPIGKSAQFTFERDGKPMEVTLTPTRREPVLRREHEFNQWGLTGRDLTIWTALEMRRPNKDGVLVTSVRPGGPVGQAKPALQEGDILLSVNGKPLHNMDELTSMTAQLVKEPGETTPTLVSFARKENTLLTVVKVGIRELDDPGREVTKAWVPVATQVLTRDLATGLGLEDQTGVRVTQVYEDGATTGEGLKMGDLILTLDGEPIPASEQHEIEVFDTMVRQYPIGAEVTLGILRDGQPRQLAMKLPARPPQPREMKRFQDYDFDFTVREVAYLDRKQRGLEDIQGGVLVEAVEPGGWAALARLAVGDLLVKIDQTPISSIDQVEKMLTSLRSQKKTDTIFMVRRGIHTLFLELEPVWDDKAPAKKAQAAKP